MAETDMAFQNQCMVPRRLMEAQSGAQVRRLHIVYFISRKGCVEHPHLIRVHHLSKNGVRLRDIKRWLGELRGTDMSESFSWSYKRKYKTGYVWQDLLDDDLVTPISDNEYVLKGSEIITDFSYSEKKSPMQKDQSSLQESAKDSSDMFVSTKRSSEVEESSPTFSSETSTLTDDSAQKVKLDKRLGTLMKQEDNSSTFHPTAVFNETNKMRRTNTVKIIDEKSVSTKSDKSRSNKNCRGASHIFRNLITCGALDINDSALVVTNNKNRGSHMMFDSNSKSCDGVKDSSKKKGQFGEQWAPSAAYKPLNRPSCSQCGKPFNPEKLHAHMKQCKGIKALAKDSNPTISTAAENTSLISRKSRNKDSVSGYFLTH